VLNNIPILQGEKEQLELLAAQRAVYSKAKRWVGLQLIFLVGVVILLAVFGDQFPMFRPWGALAGMTILFADMWTFEVTQKRLRERAAKIQEMFDCRVLALDWNHFSVGNYPDVEEIIEYANKYRKIDSGHSKLKEWYCVQVGEIPLHYARIVCQRVNIRWDSKLRLLYGRGALIFGVTSLVVLVVVALITDASFAEALLTLATISPLLRWSLREFLKQREAAVNLRQLMDHVKELWERIRAGALTDTEKCKHESRALQDALFDHRRSSPVILDLVYRLLSPASEDEANQTCERMVSDLSHLVREPEKEISSTKNRQRHRPEGILR
jgi:hypothetical protein